MEFRNHIVFAALRSSTGIASISSALLFRSTFTASLVSATLKWLVCIVVLSNSQKNWVQSAVRVGRWLVLGVDLSS